MRPRAMPSMFSPQHGIAGARRILNLFFSTQHHSRMPCAVHPRRISCVDGEYIFEIFYGEQFLDTTPCGVHAVLLSLDTYPCSLRMIYRILLKIKATFERHRIANQPQAEGSKDFVRHDQVWIWVTTKLRAAIGGYYNLYVILDF